VVIDLFSRQVIGWSMREHMTRDIVIDALRMAWFKRQPGKHTGLIFHSDRGSQYASEDFRDLLTDYGIAASMSRRGNCWDNACSETLESRAAARYALCNPPPRQGRGYRLAALLQSSQNAFDIGLLQPNGFREENASRYQKIWQT